MAGVTHVGTNVGTHVDSTCFARFQFLLPAGEKVTEGRMREENASTTLTRPPAAANLSQIWERLLCQ
jgi:hypothetical protein